VISIAPARTTFSEALDTPKADYDNPSLPNLGSESRTPSRSAGLSSIKEEQQPVTCKEQGIFDSDVELAYTSFIEIIMP